MKVEINDNGVATSKLGFSDDSFLKVEIIGDETMLTFGYWSDEEENHFHSQLRTTELVDLNAFIANLLLYALPIDE